MKFQEGHEVDQSWLMNELAIGVSKNRETPQNGWFILENPIKMDDLGGKPHCFRKHPHPLLTFRFVYFIYTKSSRQMWLAVIAG